MTLTLNVSVVESFTKYILNYFPSCFVKNIILLIN